MKDNFPKRSRGFTGIFRPSNPKKYRGNAENIVYRSRPELILMRRFDEDPNILEWSSEEVVVPYTDKFDHTFHRYFVDFWIKARTKDGIQESLIEYKPKKETKPPVQGKNKKTFMQAQKTFIKNMSMWEADNRYCQAKGWKFVVLTEEQLGITY